MVSIGLVVCALLVAGCNQKKTEDALKKAAGEAKVLASEAAGEAKVLAGEAAKEAKVLAKAASNEAKELTKEAKEVIIRPVEEALPKIEEKIKGLSGETATKAQEKFGEFKKLLEQLKTAAPERWNELKDGMIKSFEELKKLVGL
jgi:hypothetical protein